MAPSTQPAVPRDIGLFEWLFDPDTWTGKSGVLSSLLDTVTLSSVVIATAVIATVPLATILAHYRKGELTLTWLVTLSRAVPTFAVAGLLVPVALKQGWSFEPWPIYIALLLLALPPIYLNTYTSVRYVDQGVVDAARAMGFREREILLRVELALAMTVVLTGVRVAAVQVVATEPIRAFLGGDGLGRYIRDGLGQNNDTLVVGGAMLVTALALTTGLVFTVLERVILSRGIQRLKKVSRH